MVTHAQELVSNLTDLMPTQYQKGNLEAMLGLFLEALGHPLSAHCQTKSASALRFGNSGSGFSLRIRSTATFINPPSNLHSTQGSVAKPVLNIPISL